MAREYLESIVVAVILALFVRTFAVQAFKIPTGSMEENLLIGDHLLVNKLVYSPSFGSLEDRLFGKKKIERGHVVVFKFPEEPERDFIKRVIGLPGEKVEVRDKQVFIDDQPLDESYIHFFKDPPASRRPRVRPARGRSRTTGGRRWCPPGQLFVHGRQPRQQPGQPVLGLPAHRPGQGSRPGRLLVVRSHPGRVPTRRGLAMGPGHAVGLRPDPLGDGSST